MRLTRFVRLRNAIALLDMNYVAKRIHELRDLLSNDGLTFEPDNTVITEEAIFYIHPRSGMATKVALYRPFNLRPFPEKGRYSKQDAARESGETLNRYHIMRCNFLSHDERMGWKEYYQTVQRLDSAFTCQLVSEIPQTPTRALKSMPLIEVQGERLVTLFEYRNQHLYPCDHCLTKVNSLMDATPEYTPENFRLSMFLESGFESTWMTRGNYSKERGAFAEMYPSDYEAIVETRLRQAGHICELCNFDMSPIHLRHFARIHTEDYLSGGVSYIHIRCLCLGCRSEQSDGLAFTEDRDYPSFKEAYASHNY